MEIDPGLVAKIQQNMVFAADFTKAMVKLKNAANHEESCTLTPAEVKATIQGFRLLKDAHKEEGG